ncbi:hypothetical protein ASF58_04275 [Methylobacterium sp. Leaf125]|nr:hypothetical protein ASF58_04275 [Methylobacterium sp. Leaf125]
MRPELYRQTVMLRTTQPSPACQSLRRVRWQVGFSGSLEVQLVTGAAGSATRAVRLRPACPSEGMRQTSRRNASVARRAR